MLDRHQGQGRRRRLDRSHDRVDRGVAQFLEETALPVVELPGPVPHGFQQGLDRLVRDRSDGVERGWTEGAKGPEHELALLDRAAPAGDDHNAWPVGRSAENDVEP